MSTFIDTSALFAILDAEDSNHSRADLQWQDFVASDEPLFTSSYVLVESMALIQSRLGLKRCFAFDPHFSDQGFDLLP